MVEPAGQTGDVEEERLNFEFSLPFYYSYSEVSGKSVSRILQMVSDGGLFMVDGILRIIQEARQRGIREDLLYFDGGVSGGELAVSLERCEKIRMKVFQVAEEAGEKLMGLQQESDSGLTGIEVVEAVNEAVFDPSSGFFWPQQEMTGLDESGLAQYNFLNMFEEDDGGPHVCGDTAGLYFSVVDFLKRGGVAVDIRPQRVPGHVVARLSGKSDYFVDLTVAPGSDRVFPLPGFKARLREYLGYEYEKLPYVYRKPGLNVVLSNEFLSWGALLADDADRLQFMRLADELTPDVPEILSVMAVSESMVGDYDAAMSTIDRMREVYPDDSIYYLTSSRVHLRRGDSTNSDTVREFSYAQAVRDFERAVSIHRDVTGRGKLALLNQLAHLELEFHEKTGESRFLHHAVDAFHECEVISGNVIDYGLWGARVKMKIFREEGDEEFFKKAVFDYSRSMNACGGWNKRFSARMGERALAYLLGGDYEQAINDYEALYFRDEGNRTAYLLGRGLAYLRRHQSKDYELCQEDFRQAIERSGWKGKSIPEVLESVGESKNPVLRGILAHIAESKVATRAINLKLNPR